MCDLGKSSEFRTSHSNGANPREAFSSQGHSFCYGSLWVLDLTPIVMPKIKRYFKINQDINGDPKSWELSNRFGVTGLRVWLEILSISDRNEGVLPGPWQDYTRILAARCQSTTRHLVAVCQWLTSESADGQQGSSCWVVVDSQGIARVPKWAEYNKTGEPNKIPSGIQTSSPPSLPSLPSLPIKNKKKSKIRVAPPLEAVELAQLLSDKIGENLPNRTHPGEVSLLVWAWEAEKVNRIDGHSWAEIRELIVWSQADSFWRANILSMQKLRKQWNQLLAKKAQISQESKAEQARRRTAEILTRGL